MPSEGTVEMKRRRASESLFVRLFQNSRPAAAATSVAAAAAAAAGNNQYPSRGNYSTEEKGSEENGPTGSTKLKQERACYFVVTFAYRQCLFLLVTDLARSVRVSFFFDQ